MNELERWKKLIENEHLYYDANRDKITRLEAIEERDRILELYPEAKGILDFIVIADKKHKEGVYSTEECEYIKETRQFPPTKGPSVGGLEFWLCNRCGLILHCTDICPFCGVDCNSGEHRHFHYRYQGWAKRVSMKEEIERGAI